MSTLTRKDFLKGMGVLTGAALLGNTCGKIGDAALDDTSTNRILTGTPTVHLAAATASLMGAIAARVNTAGEEIPAGSDEVMAADQCFAIITAKQANTVALFETRDPDEATALQNALISIFQIPGSASLSDLQALFPKYPNSIARAAFYKISSTTSADEIASMPSSQLAALYAANLSANRTMKGNSTRHVVFVKQMISTVVNSPTTAKNFAAASNNYLATKPTALYDDERAPFADICEIVLGSSGSSVGVVNTDNFKAVGTSSPAQPRMAISSDRINTGVALAQYLAVNFPERATQSILMIATGDPATAAAQLSRYVLDRGPVVTN